MIARLYAWLLPIGPLGLTPCVVYWYYGGAVYCAFTEAPAC